MDLKTGKRKWHYQIVHHPLWNLDMAAAPLLADLLFLFDRVTGRPLWPIEERSVPNGRDKPAGR